MSKLTPRQIEAQKTKKKILETSLRLFSTKGYNQVTVDEIVKKSGTSKGAFYTHFQSKYEIFLEKFKEIDEFYWSFSQTIPHDMRTTEKILSFVDAQMTYIQHELGKEIMRVIYINALTPNPHNYFLDESRHLYNILTAFVSEGQGSDQLRSDLSLQEIIETLTRCMRGCIYDWCMSDDSFNLPLESRRFFAVVLRGLLRDA
ncbi:TetR/AcrR family transcriptional regulator [Brevibacillus humidisoli]|uniref:TetR/AcrR family transcriptional regulator n=1 Tax=Brevibacillus humidisoli TaxID=2895522 RepID=UPI001E61C1B5|nr:TetR/AcrR family transcriptional regulator [Brevibacillus humidisoli]UFJ39477.1 TetR/AcrR family transcriptional regulator [Brevibacillus humidisoli]